MSFKYRIKEKKIGKINFVFFLCKLGYFGKSLFTATQETLDTPQGSPVKVIWEEKSEQEDEKKGKVRKQKKEGI
jgi:hypothetical protein